MMAEYIISEEELNSMLDALGSPHIKYGEEIIRCKDCKHLVGDCEYIWCEQTGRCVKQDGFCAWAERDE